MPDPSTTQLHIAPDVRAALAAGRPVVALESTIVTHGMPYPENAETALKVEAAVRDEGAVPATIALIDGRPTIGLDEATLRTLAGTPDVAKASRRDLPMLIATGRSAGTTVAATMALAARAGITVFATGGIGGVHRGVAESWDISADLLEFTASPVIVVCAGCKSILDVDKTLEVLETHGVPVIGYRTDTFPLFFSREGGPPLEHFSDSPQELAAIWRAHVGLGCAGGMLVANPVMAEHAADAVAMERATRQAVSEARAQKVEGKRATPFLLARIAELTGGASLKANIALIEGNARLAAQLAAALSA